MDTSLKVIVRGELFDEKGNLKNSFVTHNLIVNNGFNFLASAWGNNTRPAPMNLIAVGSGNTSPTAYDTSLVQEVLKKRGEFSYQQNTKYLTLGVTLGAGEATGDLREAGIFNSEGTMFDRVTFPTISKGALDTFRFSFTLMFSEDV